MLSDRLTLASGHVKCSNSFVCRSRKQLCTILYFGFGVGSMQTDIKDHIPYSSTRSTQAVRAEKPLSAVFVPIEGFHILGP
jgi:hypothetical protein